MALNFYGWFCDFDESRRKQFYGKQEGNLFFRGAKGQLNVTKAVIIFVLVELAPSIVMMLFLHYAKGEDQSNNIGYYGGACWNAAFALLHYLTFRSNVKRSKANRIKQIAMRKEWQSQEWTLLEFATKYLKLTKGNDGETFLPLFAWIRVLNQPVWQDTLFSLSRALIDWSKLPDEQAWPDKKFHPKV